MFSSRYLCIVDIGKDNFLYVNSMKFNPFKNVE